MQKLARLAALGVAAAFLCAAAATAADSKKGAAKPQPAAKASGKMSRETYGTTAESYYRMGAAEFTGMEVAGVDSWTDVWYSTAGNLYRRYGQADQAYFIGVPHLPAGAKLTYLELDDCGGDTATVHLYLYNCDYTGDCGAAPAATIDATAGCGADTQDISGLNIEVDNFTGQILLRVVTDASDGSNSFAGVIIGYLLQVSPAPAVATFPDVPTSDFGFQYVEALVASGITGGCGNGLYCPDSFVTRRQMAIFIAKALGLHFQ